MKKILIYLYNLILEPTLSNEERKIITAAKNDLENGNYYKQVLYGMRVSLTSLALSKKCHLQSKPYIKY